MLVIQSCPTPCNPMDTAHQSLLSMEFSRQEFWTGYPFSSLGTLTQGLNPGLMHCKQILSHGEAAL